MDSLSKHLAQTLDIVAQSFGDMWSVREISNGSGVYVHANAHKCMCVLLHMAIISG